MIDTNKLVRKNILELEPYACAQTEFKREDSDAVFLDANENPYENGCNRYPDPLQTKLKNAIAKLKGVSTDNLLLGNGSDEIIDLLIRSYCEPGQDNIIVFSPGYSMYEVTAKINDAQIRKIDMAPDLLPDWAEMAARRDEYTKLIFLCSPNNPIGNVIPLQNIEKVCEQNDSLIVVDEAYIDFADIPSAIGLIRKYPNLVVMQTMSKSWSAAGLRLGICVADKKVIDILSKVKMPYNISSAAQNRALEILNDQQDFQSKLEAIKQERARLYTQLKELGIFKQVHPSQANFILVITDDARALYKFMLERGVVTRVRDIAPRISGGVRISVGTPEENDKVLEILREWKEGKK